MKTITSRLSGLITLMLLAFLAQPSFAQKKKYDPQKAKETIATFKKTDSGMNAFFSSSYGYAVFPSIGKGAIGVGAASGKGLVYRRGTLMGGSKLTQVTVGLQLGGQAYSEVIFFETEEAFQNFIDGKFQFAAQASAVALKSGASADAKYTEGVAVFTMTRGGLMYEASIGGQKFKFVPMNKLK